MLRHLRAITTLFLAVLATLTLSGCASPTPAPVVSHIEPATLPASPPSYEDLARHYAPVIRQGTFTNQDYITAVDFDGDWFLDPARALAFHASFGGDFSLEYVYNPYLADLGLKAE